MLSSPVPLPTSPWGCSPICTDWPVRRRPFTWPLCARLHIFMTQAEHLGAMSLLSINHSCFPNHRGLHPSLSYLLLSSEKRCEDSRGCSGLHDMICVSARRALRAPPCAPRAGKGKVTHLYDDSAHEKRGRATWLPSGRAHLPCHGPLIS